MKEHRSVRGSDGKELIDKAMQLPNELIDPQTGIKYKIQKWSPHCETGGIVTVECGIFPCLPPSDFEKEEESVSEYYVSDLPPNLRVYTDGTGGYDD